MSKDGTTEQNTTEHNRKTMSCKRAMHGASERNESKYTWFYCIANGAAEALDCWSGLDWTGLV